YKGYGHFRLVPDVLLKGLPSGGTAGQYSQVSTGSGHQVRTTFFWQRFDPDLVSPLRTILIDQDMTDVNLLDLFVATYGAPTEGERVKFIVAEDVLITASTTSDYALITDDWPPSTELSMDVLGVVAGRGGDGGDGLDQGASATAKKGHDGGNAILATYPLALNNQGIVAGGGGGGGASANWRLTSGTASSYIGNAGGSGGVPFGAGGSGGTMGTTVNWHGDGPDGKTATRDGNNTSEVFTVDNVLGVRTHIGGGGGTYGHNGWVGGGGGEDGENMGDYWTANEWREGGQGGLAGIALTGSIALTGNPALGR
ncbi:MAG: hypothetical protein VXW65_00710, partial [Pseudomonadota bacterium]|nr:hypothetical protein [Pseudomonadota bacterium]